MNLSIVMASIVASLATSFSLTPMDYLKTQQQINHKSIRHNIQQIYIKGGICGFWTGGRQTLMHSIPSTTIYLTSYQYLQDQRHEQSTFVSGAMARLISIIFTSPFELLKTQSQARSSFGGLSKIATRQSLYQAFTLNVIRDVPFSAIYWALLVEIKKGVVHYNRGSGEEVSFMLNLISGYTAGSITAFVTCPLDVIKTKCSIHNPRQYSTTTPYTEGMRIIRNDGIRGLFAGVVARMLRVGLGCGLLISIFDSIVVAPHRATHRRNTSS